MKRRSLPKYVSEFRDRHGKWRLRFRRVGYPSRYFTAAPPSREFWDEYDACMSAKPPTPAQRRNINPGSIDALLARYYRSNDYQGNASKVSLAKRRAVLEAFRAKHGHRPVASAPFEKLDAYIADIAKGKGGKGGPFAAETARKQLKRLFAYAVKLGWRMDNPIEHVSYRAPKTDGYHSWTEDEIAQYRAHWPLGTKQRLAMELMLWTGKRRSDAFLLGPQHARDGVLSGTDKKTGKSWQLPIAPQLQEAIDAAPSDHLCFVPSQRGRPYTDKSFGNQFKRWCKLAGLPHCSAHGLRKAISRRMAELGIGNAGIKSVTLHSRDEEVSTYVRAADQKRLAKGSIDAVSEWEMSNVRQIRKEAKE